MENKTQSSKQYSQEENKMQKVIVEVPELKEGQTLSSGGIRENGRIATQYKNPRPYVEPTLPPVAVNRAANAELIKKQRSKARRQETGMYFAGMAWQRFGEQLLQEGLDRLEVKVSSWLFGDHTSKTVQLPSNEPEIIDVEVDEIETVDDDDKIIRFPSKRAI